jgi:hypothetical protein
MKTSEERFLAKLAPQDPVTGCIEWAACCKQKGYGLFYYDGRSTLAHRYAWERKHGPVPEGLCVLHECDNPPCCNDAHLFLGTKADNNADKKAKDRGSRLTGVRNGRAKLTEAAVLEIRRRLAAGESQRKTAATFGIDPRTVKDIKTGKIWSHLKL